MLNSQIPLNFFTELTVEFLQGSEGSLKTCKGILYQVLFVLLNNPLFPQAQTAVFLPKVCFPAKFPFSTCFIIALLLQAYLYGSLNVFIHFLAAFEAALLQVAFKHCKHIYKRESYAIHTEIHIFIVSIANTPATCATHQF